MTKEMYEFEDKGGRRMALRPEGTASVVRAFLQHRPPLPCKAWYVGAGLPLRAPAGGPVPPAPPARRRGARHRGPRSRRRGDRAAGRLLRRRSASTEVTLPRQLARATASAARPIGERWSDYLARARGRAVRRAPRRAGRRTRCGSSTASGPSAWRCAPRRPRLVDFLCDDCRAHFERCSDGSRGARDRLRPRRRCFVRGLDYYTRTTFEFASEALDVGAERRRRRRPLRRARRRARGSGHPGHRLRRRDRADPARPGRRGRRRGERPTVEVFVVDLTGGDAARDLTTSCGAAGSPSTGRSTAAR